MLSYDSIPQYYQMLLDLELTEGIGATIFDNARPHHEITLVNVPLWTSIASGLSVLDFNGIDDYAYASAVDTADLDFTTGDYSILFWCNLSLTALSEMVIAKYTLDTSGWELYFYCPDILQLRHHHASLAPNNRDGAYSTGWTPGTWEFGAITRSGLYPQHYRNGVKVDVGYSAGGVEDPDSSVADDLVIGCRFTKNADWYKGSLVGLRVAGCALSGADVYRIYEREKHWFL